jgi:hypothetical protein
MVGSFMAANNMHIYARTQQAGRVLVASMNLRGTYQAMLMTARCNGEGGGTYTRPPANNPFNV